jgi:acetyl esterase/lipase
MPLVQQLRGAKRRYQAEEVTRRRIVAQLEKPAPFAPPPTPGLEVSRSDASGWPVYTIAVANRGEHSPAPARVVYFHGGAYVYEIGARHWNLVADLARRSGATFIVPVYPLAPIGTADTVVERAAALCADYPGAILMGDSAGGGLAAAVGVALADGRRSILIAPWLDARLTDPAIPALEKRDPWLARPGMRAAMELWRGELPLDDWRVSPLLGDLSGLGPATVIVGDRDLLLADARAFAARAPSVDLRVARGMVHVFPLLPIREARTARELIATVLMH